MIIKVIIDVHLVQDLPQGYAKGCNGCVLQTRGLWKPVTCCTRILMARKGVVPSTERNATFCLHCMTWCRRFRFRRARPQQPAVHRARDRGWASLVCQQNLIKSQTEEQRDNQTVMQTQLMEIIKMLRQGNVLQDAQDSYVDAVELVSTQPPQLPSSRPHDHTLQPPAPRPNRRPSSQPQCMNSQRPHTTTTADPTYDTEGNSGMCFPCRGYMPDKEGFLSHTPHTSQARPVVTGKKTVTRVKSEPVVRHQDFHVEARPVRNCGQKLA